MQRSTHAVPGRRDPDRGPGGLGLTARKRALIRRLTAARARPYRERMDNAAALAQIRALAARVEALVERTQRLTDENRSLRHQQEQLIGERSQLLTKNEQARSRVEAMIVRLKSLEQHT
ncbi:cell division protein ZapB [Xanthomonas arboricola]|nr:cell division protein ZapB [Xanthomonas sp. 4461]